MSWRHTVETAEIMVDLLDDPERRTTALLFLWAYFSQSVGGFIGVPVEENERVAELAFLRLRELAEVLHEDEETSHIFHWIPGTLSRAVPLRLAIEACVFHARMVTVSSGGDLDLGVEPMEIDARVCSGEGYFLQRRDEARSLKLYQWAEEAYRRLGKPRQAKEARHHIDELMYRLGR